MSRDELIALAERVEQATVEQQREMLETAFYDIRIADSQEHEEGFQALLEAGGFIDAALTLVPGDAAFRIYHWPKQTEGDRACVLFEGGRETWAATPALAICAASLRAKAGDQS